jgi:hypothetical protein
MRGGVPVGGVQQQVRCGVEQATAMQRYGLPVRDVICGGKGLSVRRRLR